MIEMVCQHCGHRCEGHRMYWHKVLCQKNPTRVLSWDGWKIGEVGKLPPKKGE